MTPQITIQLYSVREQATADYEGTIRAIADMGFGCVEPAGYPGTTPAKAASLFKELGLEAPSCHGALPIGDNRNAIIDQALAMGHKYIITGVPPGGKASVTTADAIKTTAERYAEAAAFAAPHGIQVGYHNHDWDLAEIDGTPGYRLFLENTPESVLWEADIFWVTKAGIDPVAFVQEIGPRGKLLHFKDGVINADDSFTEAETESGKVMVSKASPFLPAGAGDVNLPGTAKVAQYTEYIVVELDSYAGDMLKAVQQSYTYLTRNGIANGRK